MIILLLFSKVPLCYAFVLMLSEPNEQKTPFAKIYILFSVFCGRLFVLLAHQPAIPVQICHLVDRSV